MPTFKSINGDKIQISGIPSFVEFTTSDKQDIARLRKSPNVEEVKPKTKPKPESETPKTSN